MTSVPTYIAKAKLSELIRCALNGESVFISRSKEDLVQLVPIKNKKRRKFGSMKGRASVGKDLFEPLPEGELEY